ncbi:MAG TPA: Gfo/Idh/MocA family oxidoreductase, partial [Vicinamibacterales bacterium]|nr:Gfo/Idh/MocA family oxidoreductase [Vicinamibacterales bacterium]
MKAAVIGVGHLGKHHARLLASMPGITLAGVVDINTQRAAAVAREYHTTACATAGEISGLDIAVIATPTESHAELAIPLVRSGV